jgi:Fe-S cluster assembly scaffold protein SufB
MLQSRKRTQAEPAAERSLSLVDEFLDSWIFWSEAREDVRSAYERWGRCEPAERRLAFASYRAALDREDQAARVYSVWTARLRAARR